MKEYVWCFGCGEVEVEAEFCCSGHECGCMGMPDMPFCSEKCYDEYVSKGIPKETTWDEIEEM